MQQYQFAEPNGSIVTENYDKSTRPTQEQIEELFKEALFVYGHQAKIEKKTEETYQVNYSNGNQEKEIYVSLKPVTPGGRSSDLADEHRILQLPIYLNWVNTKKQEGKDTAFLGIYTRGGVTLICAWKVVGTNADPKSRISKQVKVNTLAYAMRNGIAQQKRTDDDYVCVFRKEFIYFFLENAYQLTGTNVQSIPLLSSTSNLEVYDNTLETNRLITGANILLYGVPGSGKSWTIENEYCKPNTVISRLVFHPDYTNGDFIGQILPVVDSEKQVTYEFTPGPFTKIIKDAYSHPQQEYVLIIEEINRGNAPAIFGEVFQLLDRTFESKTSEGITYPRGTSEYGITHKNMALHIYGNETHKVRIPSNLSIIGTMNTSDQNVFTLDTAFQRRWQMRLIENNFDNVRISLAKANILDTGVTWKKFCEVINGLIISSKSKMVSAEDKRLGVYFIHEKDIVEKTIEEPSNGFKTLKEEYNELLKKQRDGNATDEDITRIQTIRNSIMDMSVFPQKVIKYLWDDAFKFNPEALFNIEGDGKLESLEQVIQTFVYSKGRERFKIFKQSVRDSL